ncbi:hypothetical protein KUTeg_003057 [Tegillarca granosa]|uniref:UNC93-like protein MFSD11 n=1 Tax=Tegillarca granosa TaxID=220873 RepID=A0ABQ9FP82_TEGGR|nr:hypothetical protein KUTeg_003057 [Tegillarca granosa]
MADNKIFDVRLYNIIMLGVAFMLLFTAFQTTSMAEKSVLDSAKNDSNGTFNGDGYTSLSIIYVVFSVANWIAPPFVTVVGPKLTMFIGGTMYCLFILQFLKPMTWALYLGSVLVGFGAAILWTAQGNFLTINSDSETVARNSGIFWALLQCSLLFGNMYSHFVLKGSDITTDERTKLFIGLSGAAVLGTLCFLTLRNRRATDSENLINLNASGDQKVDGPLQALSLELTFFSGVYSTALGNTQHFGSDAKGLIGIAGMFVGVGEILGGAVFGLFGKRVNTHGRDPIVLFGFIVHMSTFFLVYINIPNEAPLHQSAAATFITSNKYIAVLCAFLLGLGDSSFNTQIYSILGFMFPEDSSPAFALFKFVQSIAAAVAFYYSEYLILQWQLLILVVLGAFGTLCFCSVEWESNRISRGGYQQIS